jgi:hypothetical protein
MGRTVETARGRPPTQATIGGSDWCEPVPLQDGEKVLTTALCYRRITAWFWPDGDIYLTTHRLVWTPLGQGLRFFSSEPISMSRGQVLKIGKAGAPTPGHPGWAVQTAQGEHRFSFRWFRYKLRAEWLEALNQWAHKTPSGND